MSKDNLTPRKGSAGRATLKGEARDNPMKGAAGRTPSTPRGTYPADNFPKPSGGQHKGFIPRASTGDPMDNKMVNRQRKGPVVREGGGSGKPAGSTGIVGK